MSTMSPTSPTPLDPRIAAIPYAETMLSAEQLAAAAGISTATLERLVRAGVVESAANDGSVFTAAAAARLRRMLRLHHDLEVNLEAATIIVELLERLDRLEDELVRWRASAFGEPPRS
jgi:DNA-binding transcriptional regulator YhcF (GntR family)